MKNNILIMLASGFLVTLLIGFYLISNVQTGTEVTNNKIKTENELLAAENTEKGKPIILKIAHNFHISHPQHMALVEKFIPKVEKGSNWNIRVEVYPNSQLVEEKKYVQGVRQGTIEMCIAGQSIVDIFPKAKVIGFPYVFDNYDEAKTILNGELGAKITQDAEGSGIYSLAWGLNGFSQISLAKNNSNSKNKLATAYSESSEDTLKAMGFDALPLDMEDMTMTLRQGTVDGHDNPPLLSYYNGWYENQDKIIITNHIIHPSMYMISKKFWDTLPDDYKDLIKNAAKESANYEIELLKNQEQEIFSALKDKGFRIETPDLTPYKKAVSPLYEKWIKNDKELGDVFEELKKNKYIINKNN